MKDKIACEEVDCVANRLAEFQFFPRGRMLKGDSGVEIPKKRNLGTQSVKIEEFSFTGIVQVRRVICDFIDVIDELRLEGRAQVQQIFSKFGEIGGGILARMLDDAFAHFKGEIQSRKIEVAAF